MPQTRATLCKFLKTNYYSYLFLVSFENAINWRSLQHCVVCTITARCHLACVMQLRRLCEQQDNSDIEFTVELELH